MPKVIKKRVSKRDDDAEVEEKLSSLRDTIMDQQRTAIKYGAAVIIVIIAVVGLIAYSSFSQSKAQGLAYEGYKIYYSNPQAEPAVKEDQYKKALELFKKAYDKKSSPFSLYYIAACYYDLGKYDDALKTLKEFTQKYSNDQVYAPLAYQKMVLAYLKKGDANEAEKALQALYNLKGDVSKDFALMEYGKLLEKQGKAEEAKKKYDELVKKFPNSPFAAEIKTKLGEKKEG